MQQECSGWDGEQEHNDAQEDVSHLPANRFNERGKDHAQHHGGDAAACCRRTHDRSVLLHKPAVHDDRDHCVAAAKKAQTHEAADDVEGHERIAEREGSHGQSRPDSTEYDETPRPIFHDELSVDRQCDGSHNGNEAEVQREGAPVKPEVTRHGIHEEAEADRPCNHCAHNETSRDGRLEILAPHSVLPIGVPVPCSHLAPVPA